MINVVCACASPTQLRIRPGRVGARGKEVTVPRMHELSRQWHRSCPVQSRHAGVQSGVQSRVQSRHARVGIALPNFAHCVLMMMHACGRIATP